jgi:hypothetical protein
MKYCKKIAINIVLFILLCFFSVFIIEFFLFNFTNLRNDESKIWIKTKECHMNCYSSNPKGYFPLFLKILKDKNKLERFLDNNIVENLIEKTPYCIVYDCPKRFKGFFPERKKEVAIVGDSFVFGEGVGEEDTLGYLLGLKFTQANFRNYGGIGVNIEEVFNTVSQILKENKIKDIVYFYNLNDLVISPEIAAQQKYINDLQNIRWDNVKRPHNLFARLFLKSTVYRLIENSIILHKETTLTIRNYLDMYSPANAFGLEQTKNLLVAVNNRAKEKGTNFYIVIYPLLYKNIFGKYPFVPIHESLKNIFKKYNIQCIDAYPAFEKYYSLKNFIVHPVDYHPNGLANKRIVEYLAEKDGFLQSYK